MGTSKHEMYSYAVSFTFNLIYNEDIGGVLYHDFGIVNRKVQRAEGLIGDFF